MVTTELKDHQKRIKERLRHNRGVIAAHGLGSGKTLSAISTIDISSPTYIITPASLQENFKKEVSKHSGIPIDRLKVVSYEKFLRDPYIEPGSQVILDEAHRLRNTDTKTYQTIRDAVKNSSSRLLLTGTPIYNNPSDIAALVNVAANSVVLPNNPMEFKKRYIQESQVSPGFWKSMIGVKPGVAYRMKNRTDFSNKVSPYVDKYIPDNKEDYPELQRKVVKHLMTKPELNVYNYTMGKAPLSTRLKVRFNLPPSKSEAQNMNAFLSAARQASNTSNPFGQSDPDAPKIKAIADNLQQRLSKNPEFRGLVYSNYLEAGVEPVSQELSRRNIPHATFTGKLSKNQKEELVKNYNAGKTPVLLVSSAGGEGLDLKGTRAVHIMEPHWNNEKIKQVIGRSARYQSHSHLPKEQRLVDVYFHQAKLPQGKLSKMLKLKRATSTDEYISSRATDKENLMKEFLSAIKA